MKTLFFLILFINTLQVYSQNSYKNLVGIKSVNSIILSWSNINYNQENTYIIEGSQDSENWYKKKVIDTDIYTFKDYFSSKYYRLIQRDKNGFSIVLGITKIYEHQPDFQLLLFSKINNKCPIEVILENINTAYEISLIIHDLEGKTIFSKTLQAAKGERVITSMDLSKLLIEGEYILELHNGDQNYYTSVIVN